MNGILSQGLFTIAYIYIYIIHNVWKLNHRFVRNLFFLRGIDCNWSCKILSWTLVASELTFAWSCWPKYRTNWWTRGDVWGWVPSEGNRHVSGVIAECGGRALWEFTGGNSEARSARKYCSPINILQQQCEWRLVLSGWVVHNSREEQRKEWRPWTQFGVHCHVWERELERLQVKGWEAIETSSQSTIQKVAKEVLTQ